MLDEARVYNRALTAAEVTAISQLLPSSRILAKNPSPADKAMDVPVDSVLSWTASEFAATHDVYLAKSFADANNASRAKPANVLVSQGQTATTYTPATALDFGQTYYWRVDEVNKAPDNTIYKGNIWSFTVEPYGYPITSVTATASSAAQRGPGEDHRRLRPHGRSARHGRHHDVDEHAASDRTGFSTSSTRLTSCGT